ncbi:MAG: hypothetical protein F9K45_00765 [Melioribacteraceae bacterium]|nr:MAG: hypothetical protein F9K45_00765 [Melioribacteraceae bacterium]
MTQRAKLELELNKPTEIELLYDECISGNGQNGEYFLYAVKSQGKEWAYFPPEPVHSQIRNLRRGDKVVITKLSSKRGNKTVTTFDVQTEVPSPKHRAAAGNLEDDSQEHEFADRFYDIILQSYQDALKIQGELNGLVDVNKIAITLFIARSR